RTESILNRSPLPIGLPGPAPHRRRSVDLCNKSVPVPALLPTARHYQIMRSRAEVDLVLALGKAGATQSEIARLTGISRTTARTWLTGRIPHHPRSALAPPPGAYAYLLGLYLGDGFIARGRGASCLRI